MPTRIRICGLLCGAMFVLVALLCARIASQGGSILAWGGCAIAACLAALLVPLALAPNRLLDSLLSAKWIQNWRRALLVERSRTDNPAGKWPGLVIVLAGCLFASNLLVHWFNPPPVDLDDQGAYLETAKKLHNPVTSLWSIPTVIRELRTGTFREDNRHPLYLALLAHRPTEQFGRSLSCLIAMAGFVTATCLVQRRFGGTTAALFALLLAVNQTWSQHAIMVVCESLLCVWVMLAFFAVLPPLKASYTPGRRWFRLIAASACLGMAWLTKATGLLFWGIFLVWLVWQAFPPREPIDPETESGERELEERSVVPPITSSPYRQWLIALMFGVAGFLVVGWPLIERNLKRFDNPFHNANSLLLFADSYDEFQVMLQDGVTTSEASRAFLDRHTVGDLVVRELHGLVWEAFIMLRMLGPTGLGEARVLFGTVLAIFCLVGLWSDHRPARWLLLSWILASWMVFAWYVPIAAGDRFPMPLLIPILAYAARGAVLLLRTGKQLSSDREASKVPLPAN